MSSARDLCYTCKDGERGLPGCPLGPDCTTGYLANALLALKCPTVRPQTLNTLKLFTGLSLSEDTGYRVIVNIYTEDLQLLV